MTGGSAAALGQHLLPDGSKAVRQASRFVGIRSRGTALPVLMHHLLQTLRSAVEGSSQGRRFARAVGFTAAGSAEEAAAVSKRQTLPPPVPTRR